MNSPLFFYPIVTAELGSQEALDDHKWRISIKNVLIAAKKLMATHGSVLFVASNFPTLKTVWSVTCVEKPSQKVVPFVLYAVKNHLILILSKHRRNKKRSLSTSSLPRWIQYFGIKKMPMSWFTNILKTALLLAVY